MNTPAQQDTATTSRHANRSNQHQPMAGAMEHSAPRGQRDAADDEGQNDDGHSSYYDRALELLGIRHVVCAGVPNVVRRGSGLPRWGAGGRGRGRAPMLVLKNSSGSESRESPFCSELGFFWPNWHRGAGTRSGETPAAETRASGCSCKADAPARTRRVRSARARPMLSEI